MMTRFSKNGKFKDGSTRYRANCKGVMPMPNKIDLTNVDIMALQKALTPRLTKYIPYEPTPKQRAFLLMNDVKEILYGG